MTELLLICLVLLHSNANNIVLFSYQHKPVFWNLTIRQLEHTNICWNWSFILVKLCNQGKFKEKNPFTHLKKKPHHSRTFQISSNLIVYKYNREHCTESFICDAVSTIVGHFQCIKLLLIKMHKSIAVKQVPAIIVPVFMIPASIKLQSGPQWFWAY